MNKTTSVSINVSPIIFVVVFVLATLKIAEVGGFETVSWWWITLPIWIFPAIILCVAGVGLVVAILVNLLK